MINNLTNAQKKKRSRFLLDGSLTVEITLLMPFIIGVFLFIFFTLYYFHDIVALNKGVSTALIRGSMETEDRVVSEMTKAFNDIRLLGKWELDPRYDMSGNEVSVAFEGEMEAAEGLFRKLIKGGYTYKTEGKSERIDEVKYIRSRRKRN